MGFGEIVKAIVEYGFYPVLMAAILWIILTAQKKQNQAADKQEERLTILIESGVKLALKEAKKHNEAEEAENRRVNTYIRTQLDAVVAENGASRAFCVAYHNGGTYLNARNFAKCSIVAESVDNQTRALMLDYQNVQRALFIELDNELATTGEFYLDKIETIKERSPGCYQLLKQWGTDSIYFKALVDNTSNLVLGFIAAEFNSGKPKDLEALKLCLSKKAQRISGAIQVSHIGPGGGCCE